MEERVLISLLLDFYGPLLTDKQRLSLQLHHEDDMSLARSPRNWVYRVRPYMIIYSGLDTS